MNQQQQDHARKLFSPLPAFILLLAFSFLTSKPAHADQRYPAFGIVLKTQPPKNIVISCAEIPHFMEAMHMTFIAANPSDLAACGSPHPALRTAGGSREF